MKYLIYGLVDPRTLLVRYVGKSTSGLKRPGQHRNLGITTGPYCKHWIASLLTLGLSYDVVVLEYTDRVALDHAECWWIAYGRGSGWPLTNLTSGGEGSLGRKLSEDTKKKISQKLLGTRPSNDTREKMSRSHTGLLHTQETKDRIRQAHTGKAKSLEHRLNLSLANKGKTITEETKQKLSRVLKGRPKTEEHKRRIGAAHKGRTISPETRAKISATLTGRTGKTHTEETRRKQSEAAKRRWARR